MNDNIMVGTKEKKNTSRYKGDDQCLNLSMEFKMATFILNV